MSKQLVAARLASFHRFPYFSTVISSMALTPSEECPTMGIDQRCRLYYNEEFIAPLTLDNLVGLLVHESLHIYMRHAQRCKAIGADPKMWNIAADLEINDDPDLVALLPEGGVHPDDFGYPRNLTAEQYYRRLMENAEKLPPGWPRGRSDEDNPGKDDTDTSTSSDDGDSRPGDLGRPCPGKGNAPGKGDDTDSGDSSGNNTDGDSNNQNGKGKDSTGIDDKVGSGNCGSGATGVPEGYEDPVDSKDNPGLDATETELVRNKQAQEILSSPNRGDIPGNIRRFSEELTAPPRVSVEELFKQAVRKAWASARGCADFTYRRRSRRDFGNDIILPGMHEPLPNVSIVIDTSGSMGNADINKGIDLIKQMLQKYFQLEPTVLICDASVHGIQKITDARQITLSGGGGTDMRVGIKAAMESKPNPDVLVVITDGYTPWPQRPIRGVKPVVYLVGSYRNKRGIPDWMQVIESV